LHKKTNGQGQIHHSCGCMHIQHWGQLQHSADTSKYMCY